MKSSIKALDGPIIILGASGFIGANLFKQISAVRDDVYAVVRTEKNWRLNGINKLQLIVADLLDSSAVKNIINNISPRTVFDCMAYGAYSFEKDTSLIYKTNFLAVENFVESLACTEITAYVHAGSSSEYGTNCAAPKESSECNPNSSYSVSKLAVASYLRYMGKYRNFPCINLRLYSVYGPLEDTSRLIPNLIRHALNKSFPPFVDAKTSRDFIHVDDVCAAFIYSAVKINPELYGESFNIGTGIKTTISDLAKITQTEFGVSAEPVFGSMDGRSWDLADWYSDPSLAKAKLDWSAKISLEEGLLSTANWVAQLTVDEMVTLNKKYNPTIKPSLSAVIACYKDSQAIPYMYRRLSDTFAKLKIDYEIIFVNDGSPDNSEEVIRKISENDSCVIGISHSRNFGSQMAFRSGMEISSKDGVVLLDGDLQDPPELIESFYKQWQSGFDVVYGRRVKREMSWHWELLYKLFYRVFSAFSYIKIPLDAGDFSLIDRRVVRWMLNCPERDLFMRGLRAYVGFRQTGVDYIRPERMFGVTTNSFIKNIDWAKKGIFSFSNTPLSILTAVGVGAFALSTILAITVACLRLFIPDIAPRGITTLLIVVLLLGSFNIFAVGLVGEYIGKIMLEVKRRPRLIRTGLIRNGKLTTNLPDGS